MNLKKMVMLMALMLCLIPLVTAVKFESGAINSESDGLTILGTFGESLPYNTAGHYSIQVVNSSTYFKSGVTCELHIHDMYKTGNLLYSNISNDFNGDGEITFPIDSTVHSYKGVYNLAVVCNTSSQTGFYENLYYTTKDGDTVAEDNFGIFINVMFLIGILLSLYVLFSTVVRFITLDQRVWDVLIAWGSLVLMLFTTHLSESYLINTFIETISNNLFTALIIINGLIPLIAFAVTLMVKGFQKKKPLDPGEVYGGGRY